MADTISKSVLPLVEPENEEEEEEGSEGCGKEAKEELERIVMEGGGGGGCVKWRKATLAASFWASLEDLQGLEE